MDYSPYHISTKFLFYSGGDTEVIYKQIKRMGKGKLKKDQEKMSFVNGTLEI